MKELNERIRELFGYTAEEYVQSINCTVDLALAICIYAHRDQQRENGNRYYMHPIACRERYKNFVGIVDDEYDCIDLDLMNEYGIPFEGVQEVALLHDVLEDTDITLEEMEEAFDEFGVKTYFNLYIKQALLLITHDKGEGYDIYIDRMLVNPIASICKMMDLTDNMNMLGLVQLTEKELQRTIGYAKYVKQINDKWHFLENVNFYKEEYAKAKKLRNSDNIGGFNVISDYDKEWRERVKREHPTWTDEEVSEYMAHVTDLMFDWE